MIKYMGSKRRLAKHLLPIILKDRKEGQWYVEPFVGGANIFCYVDEPKIGADSNLYLISFLQSLQSGWLPFPNVTKQLYDMVNSNKNNVPPHIVGYIGFCFTYGAKFFGGYIGGVNDVVCKNRDRIGESYRAAQKAINDVSSGMLVHSSYDDLEIPPESIIYCDPPYANSTGYKEDFDHNKFWQWCRDMVNNGHRVYISEYEAPDDFECVWKKEIHSSLTKDTGAKKGIEKLFVHKSQLSEPLL